MISVFPPEFFAGNRRVLQKASQLDLIIIAGHGLLQRSGDTTYSFRQHSNFWYLTGIDEPDALLVIDKQKSYVCLPEREPMMRRFDGRPDHLQLAKRAGVDEVISINTGWERLTKRLKKSGKVGVLTPPPSYVPRADFYTNPGLRILYKRLKELVADKNLIDVRPHLVKQRMVKQALELAVMQHAIDITVETLRTVMARPFDHEYELEAAITEGFRRRGATGHAYPPIVASGINACTIHYEANNDPIDKQNLLLVDVGAEVDHYAADITRTIAPVIASSRQQAIHEAVLDIQAWAFSHLKPGLKLRDFEAKVEAYAGKHLKRLKLLTKTNHDTIREFYPHAVSHSLGLDVHDVADYDQPLKAGMVITVEPGIYIQKEGIGVRIEDDVLMTKDGIKVLSDDLPRSLV